MKAIVTIGYQGFLVEKVEDATKLVAMLSRAVRARKWHDRVTIDEPNKDLDEITMTVVPPGMKFTRATKDDQWGEKPENEVIVPPYRGTPKRLAGPRKLLGGAR